MPKATWSYSAFVDGEPRRLHPVQKGAYSRGLAVATGLFGRQDFGLGLRKDLSYDLLERPVALLALEERGDGPRGDRGPPQRPPEGERTEDHRAGSRRNASAACWVAVA